MTLEPAATRICSPCCLRKPKILILQLVRLATYHQLQIPSPRTPASWPSCMRSWRSTPTKILALSPRLLSWPRRLAPGLDLVGPSSQDSRVEREEERTVAEVEQVVTEPEQRAVGDRESQCIVVTSDQSLFANSPRRCRWWWSRWLDMFPSLDALHAFFTLCSRLTSAILHPCQ